MRYLIFPLMLIGLSTVQATDTDSFNAERRQMLDGYGWAMYDNVFSNESQLYSPLGYSLDKQIDVASIDQWREVRSGGGRSAVWQDPERGLVSAIASYLEYDAEQLYRFGAEGQWYYGAITASGRAGYLEGSLESLPFAGLDLRWYATENFSLQLGGEQINDITLGRVRLEYQPGFDKLQGLSFFASAAGGSQDNQYVLGGLRYTFGFGDSGSLLFRDRYNTDAATDRLSPRFESLYFRH